MTNEEAIVYWEGLRRTFHDHMEKEENPFGKQHYQTSIEAIDAALSALRSLTATEFAPVVHSHWEVAIGYDPKKKVQCQHCRLMNYDPEDFCPHCGARMDGTEERG